MSILRKIAAAYIVTHDPTGLFYVGSTGNIYSRWSNHRSDLSKGKHANKKLQNSFTAVEDYSLEILSVGTLEEVRDVEQRLIDRYRGDTLCCNSAPNALNALVGRTPEETAEIRRLVFESPKWQVAIRKVQKLAAAANRGRTLSEEMLEKLAVGRSKKPHPRLGATLGDEQKAKYMRSITEHRKTDEYQEFKNRMSDRHSKPISIDGVIYKNPRAAEEILGVNRNCIKKRLDSKNPKYKTWFRV